MPAEMWVANRDPVADRANLERLWANLEQCRADECVVISTVAVYAVPVCVDEGTLIEPNFSSRPEIAEAGASFFEKRPPNFWREEMTTNRF